MPNLFEKAREWLPAQVQTAAGTSFTVTRKGVSQIVPGWYGRGMQTNSSNGAARIEISEREIFITVDDYEASGFGAPKIGDRFLASGESVTFECLTPDTGEAASRFAESGRSWWRIHTKQVK